MWMYIEGGDLIELKCKSKGGSWNKLIRLTVKHLACNEYGHIIGQIPNLGGIKWDYFSKIKVLQLVRVCWG